MMNGGMMYSQRDIVLIPFPYSDLTGAKLRPALIISNSTLKEDYICCLVTSKPTKDGIELSKNTFEKGTLPFASRVKTFRLFTINDRIIRKKLCSVTPVFHNKIVRSVNEYLSIE